MLRIHVIIIQFIVLLFCFLHSFSQEEAFSYQDELIEAFKNDSINYNFIAHLSSIDTLITKDKVNQYESVLNDIIVALPPKENKPNRERKRIKKIYNVVHNQLFRKYEEDAFFTSIFTSGVYNCVSATAIYAYIFDSIEVPYAIKEYPGHVFLIAYPTTLRIHLETTAPGEYGFSSPKDSEVRDIVNNLIKMKLTTKEEVAKKGESKVYMDYFYGEEFVDKKALIGMQYYNLAITYYGEENYDQALDNIEKSLIYFPYPSSTYLKSSLIFLNLNTMKFDKLIQIKQLIEVFSGLEYDDDYSLADINYYIYKVIQNSSLETIKEALVLFEDYPEEDVKREVKTVFYTHLANQYVSEELLEDAIIYSEKLLEIDDTNKRANSIITYAVGKKIALLPLSEETLGKIDAYEKQYPQLKGNVRVDSFKAHILVKLIETSFSKKDISQGEKFITQLNTLIDYHKTNILVNRDYIAYAFFYSGKYYYRHNKFKKALDKLNRGLEFSPDNKDLLQYLKWVKEEM